MGGVGAGGGIPFIIAGGATCGGTPGGPCGPGGGTPGGTGGCAPGDGPGGAPPPRVSAIILALLNITTVSSPR